MRKWATLAIVGVLTLSTGLVGAQIFVPNKLCNVNAAFICSDTKGQCKWQNGNCVEKGVSKVFNAINVAGVSPGTCQGTAQPGCTENDYGCTTNYHFDATVPPPPNPTCNAGNLRCIWANSNYGCTQ